LTEIYVIKQQSFTPKHITATKCNFSSTVRDTVNCRYTSV